MQLDRSTVHLSSGIGIELARTKGSPPLYLQMADILGKRIMDGGYEPGAPLPSEHDLATKADVSRATAVKAFDTLVSRGVVTREQGRGTFVREHPEPNRLTKVSGFSDITRQSGAAPSHRLIRYSVVGRTDVNPAEVSPEMFSSDDALLRMERIRYRDGQPVGHHLVYIPADIADRAEVTEATASDAEFSLYRALHRIGVNPVSADEALRAVLCPAPVAEALPELLDKPMMRVVRNSRDSRGRLVELVIAHYVGTLYEYQVSINKNESSWESHEDHSQNASREHSDFNISVAERMRGTKP